MKNDVMMKQEIENRIEKLNNVIPFCVSKEEALEIQNEIIELEEKLLTQNHPCPLCGNEELGEIDVFMCMDEYHKLEWPEGVKTEDDLDDYLNEL